MKNIKHCFVLFTLVLTLTTSAWAGEMPGAGIAAPPPPPPTEADGEMPGAGITDPATQTVLSIIESILSIL